MAVAGVPPTNTPSKPPMMNVDAMIAFGISAITALVPVVVTQYPNLAPICHQISTVAGLLGTAFHLDGK